MPSVTYVDPFEYEIEVGIDCAIFIRDEKEKIY